MTDFEDEDFGDAELLELQRTTFEGFEEETHKDFENVFDETDNERMHELDEVREDDDDGTDGPQDGRKATVELSPSKRQAMNNFADNHIQKPDVEPNGFSVNFSETRNESIDDPKSKRHRALKGIALLLSEIDDAMPAYIKTQPRKMASSLPSCTHSSTVMSVTSALSGDRVYVAVGDTNNNFDELYGGDLRSLEKRIYRILRNTSQGGVLSRNVEDLVNEIMDDRRRKARQEALKKVDDKRDAFLDSKIDVGNGTKREEKIASSLLVDKYAPKTFFELLSDERTNREVLLWLKKWDPCVYGVPVSLKRQHQPFSQRNDLQNRSGIKKANWKDRNDSGTGRSQDTAHAFDNSRPFYKILLLSGAPGWGKTTLAHVVANHCGYRVVEVNASDDRTESSLKRRILDAIQMKQGVGADSRPNCLVLDEIDGAANTGEGKGAIQALLSVIKADMQKEVNSHENSDGLKKRKKVERLNRPIICICNDLFATTLRPLREVAQVYRFVAPSIRRMAIRLHYICECEDIPIESQMLRSLAEYSNRDVRSSLNTLQLLKNSSNPSLDLSNIISDANGKKDITQGAADIWKKVFHAQIKGRSSSSNGDAFELYRLLGNLGEHSLVLSGCFHNYVNMNFNDPKLTSTVNCLDWLGDADLIMNMSYTNSNFQLQEYLPASVVAVQKLAAVPERPFIEWPSAEYKAAKTRSSNQELFQTWTQNLSSDITTHASTSTLLQDLLPFLMRVVSPKSLRITSPHLMTSSEKKCVEGLVDTMIKYNLSYRSGYDSGNGSLQIDPPVDSFHQYGTNVPPTKSFGDDMRQIISHEIQMEKIKRSTFVTGLGSLKSSSTVADRSEISKVGSRQQSLAAKTVELESSKLSDNMNVNSKSTAMNTLFERSGLKLPGKRALESKDEGIRKRATTFNTSKSNLNIRYKYQEGFSAAVRRRVKMSDLLY